MNYYHYVKSVQIRSFFWSVFSPIWTEYRKVRSKSPYLVRMRENTNQKKLRIWTLSRSIYEGQTIQDCLKAPESATNIAKVSKKFKVLISKGNVNDVLTLLTNSMSNWILTLSNKTLDFLKEKHPEPMESSFLQGPFRQIYPAAYDYINESLVMRPVILTKGGSGPSGLDSDSWRRI